MIGRLRPLNILVYSEKLLKYLFVTWSPVAGERQALEPAFEIFITLKGEYFIIGGGKFVIVYEIILRVLDNYS